MSVNSLNALCIAPSVAERLCLPTLAEEVRRQR